MIRIVGIVVGLVTPFLNVYFAGHVAGAVVPHVSSNPTCATAPGPRGTSSACAYAWSTGVTLDYTNFVSGGEFAAWGPTQGNTSQGGSTQFSCIGPDFSVFIPLSAGEWFGDATLATGAPTNEPNLNFDLIVGGSNVTPPPSTSCTVPQPIQGYIDDPMVGIVSTPDGKGYWIASSNGAVQNQGTAPWYGQLYGTALNMPIVGIAPSYDSGGQVNGYWLVASDGGIFTFGGAPFYGSMGGTPLNKPIVGMATTPDGKGYWLVASDGGIFSFGDAPFYGSMGGTPLNKPIVGMATDNATGGYWLVASDGGIFSFNAPFYGSTGNLMLNKPIVEMEAAPDGSGYRFVASDGGVFCFNLPYEGSLPGEGINTDFAAGIAASGTNGYWILSIGGVYGFGPTTPT